MELMVAITITALMLFLVSRIFFDTTTAVTQGIATSQVIDNSRAISDQIERDAEAMVGPAALREMRDFWSFSITRSQLR